MDDQSPTAPGPEWPTTAPGWTPTPPAQPSWAAVPGAEQARPSTAPTRSRRAWKLALGVAAFTGVGVGAAAVAGAVTAPGTSGTPNATATASGDSTTTTTPSGSSGAPGARPRLGPGGFGKFGGPGGFGGPDGGPFIYGQFTIKGPNGYETLSERTGTVSSVTNTSGSTWSLVVKSADGTTGTFTVDTSTSVDGGEMGISSVKSGDTVSVVGTVSNGTTTAKQVTDQTVLKANGNSWRPTGPPPGATGNSGTGNSGTGNSGTTSSDETPNGPAV